MRKPQDWTCEEDDARSAKMKSPRKTSKQTARVNAPIGDGGGTCNGLAKLKSIENGGFN